MLYESIKAMYPGISDAQFSLRDDNDGRGPYIERWDRPEPQPTQADIDAAAPAVLAQQRNAAILSIDADADKIRRDVIGERATEYQAAYDEARAFKEAGYAGPVPPSVQSWVDAKAAGGVTWTAQQAADDILATAAAWTQAQQAIRANRLLRKEQAKAAADADGVAAVLYAWGQFVTTIRAQLIGG